ncbi:MAG: hypothetical protein GY754_04980 [bacterium]|nr:hypothetical protein [bacterium]
MKRNTFFSGVVSMGLVCLFAFSGCEAGLTSNAGNGSGVGSGDSGFSFSDLYSRIQVLEEETRRLQQVNNEQEITIRTLSGDSSNSIGALNAAVDSNTVSIDSNTAFINTNTASINTNTASINTNTASINTNTASININTASINMNTASIDSNAASINTNTASINNLNSNVSGHYSRIQALESEAALREKLAAPVGSIQAWHKNLAYTPTLPEGWAECNGAPVDDPHSVYYGMNTPNLNGERRFLRGSSSSGAMEDDAVQEHSHFYNAASGGSYFSPKGTYYGFHWTHTQTDSEGVRGARAASETRPVNMSVVWIMRIK